MKLNKFYQFTLTTAYEAKKLRDLLPIQLQCAESRGSYYICRGFEVKKNENIRFVLLSKVRDGYITFFCNDVYGLGEFYFITDKELLKIRDGWEITNYKEKYNAGSWRTFWHKEAIIAEFVHPIDEYETELAELEEAERKSASSIRHAKENLATLKKRF